jgi:hypothetical protein
MTRELFAFAASFLLVGLASTIMPGCVRGDDCPDIPDHPTPVAPIGNLKVIGYDDTLIQTPLPITPQSGSVEVTGEKVVILYTQDTIDYRVEYAVTGASY